MWCEWGCGAGSGAFSLSLSPPSLSPLFPPLSLTHTTHHSLGFLIEAYGMEKAKRDAIEREALQLATGGGKVEAKHWGGVVDWRALIRASGVSFEGYTLARTRHYTDVFDSIFKQDILERFPGAFGSAAQQ